MPPAGTSQSRHAHAAATSPGDGSRRRAPAGSPVARILLLVLAIGLIGLALLGGLGREDGDRTVRAADVDPTAGDGMPADDGELPAAAAAESDAPARLHADLFATRDPDDPRALGDPDAPVVMIEWGDFLCGFCARFARETEPELIARYVDTGVLRIEWRDLPLQGDDAMVAAMAGWAAAEQGAFWGLHEAFYAHDPSQLRRQLDDAGLRRVAEELDLDVEAFLAALEDQDHQLAIIEEAQVAVSLGISGTPAFLVGDRPVVGAQPLAVFEETIEAVAAEAGAELP